MNCTRSFAVIAALLMIASPGLSAMVMVVSDLDGKNLYIQGTDDSEVISLWKSEEGTLMVFLDGRVRDVTLDTGYLATDFKAIGINTKGGSDTVTYTGLPDFPGGLIVDEVRREKSTEGIVTE